MPPKHNRPKLTGEAQFLHHVFNGSAVQGDALKAARKILGESSKEDDKSSRWDLQAFLNHLDRLQKVIIRARDKGKKETADRLVKSLLDSIFSEEAGFITTKLSPRAKELELMRRNSQEVNIARHEQRAPIKISIDDISENDWSEYLDTIRSNQKSQISNWVNYLTESESIYPVWFKFYALRSILSLKNRLDYTEDEDGARTDQHFKKRDPDTLDSFPELNREALAKTFAVISRALASQQKYKNMPSQKNLSNNVGGAYLGHDELPTEKDKNQFDTSFSRTYAKFMDTLGGIQDEEKKNVEGYWLTYKSGDANKLTDSLQGFGTGWCIADLGTSENYLNKGNIHVYYSQMPKDNESRKVPRLCVRYNGDLIEEVRGIDSAQGVENIILPVLEEKLSTLDDNNDYWKTAKYQKYVTAILEKHKTKQELTVDELKALWGIGYTTDEQKGFGYSEEDSYGENDLVEQVMAIREGRNQRDDLLKIFNDEDINLREEYIKFEEILREILLVPMSMDDEILEDLLSKSGIPHSYIAERLLEIGDVETVFKNYKKFKNLDEKRVVDLFIKNDASFRVADLIDQFKNVSHSYIANRLLATSQSSWELVNYIKSFQGLDKTIAYRLVEIGEPQAVFNNWEVFEDVDQQEIINIMLKKDDLIVALAENIEEFEPRYHENVALILVQKYYLDLLKENIDKFKLSEATLDKLKPYL